MMLKIIIKIGTKITFFHGVFFFFIIVDYVFQTIFHLKSIKLMFLDVFLMINMLILKIKKLLF